MTPADQSNHPNFSGMGETACGGLIKITPTTPPFIHYKDQIVYFCGCDCKQLYDEDPMNSCMAARILSGK